MSSDNTHDTTSTTEGPSLLEERTIGGILVHFVAIPTGAVGAGLVYLVSTNEFTKQNARNALNWHLTVLALTVVTFGTLLTHAEFTGQGVTDIVVLPSPVATVAGVVIIALLLLWMLVTFWTFFVGFIAMGKATFGTAWPYPLTPAIVDRFGSRITLPGGWPVLVIAYIILAPIIIGAVVFGSGNGTVFFAATFGLTGLIMVLTPLAAVAMYLHSHRTRPADANWQPPVVAYIGAPSVVAVAGYMFSETFTDSINPAGDAIYVFLATFWVSAIVYVVRWRMMSK